MPKVYPCFFDSIYSNKKINELKSNSYSSLFHTVLLWILLSLSFSVALAQNNTLTFKEKDLTEVIQSLEEETALTFNYEPDLLDNYAFSGALKLENPDTYIARLLQDTPLAFEVESEQVLIFLSEKENYTLCGYVKDSESQAPLLYANLMANGLQQGTHTNENGYFEFSWTGYKNQSLTISYVGYLPKTIHLYDFEGSDCASISLEVNPRLIQQEIVVTDYLLRGISEGEAYSSTHMDYGQLANKHSALEHDILKTVQLLPGVTSVDESATNLNIRGSTPDQNLILWENATLYDPGHFFGMISSINPYVIEEVDVHKGVFDPQYDNRVGGIVDMSLKDDIGDSFSGGVGSTLTEAHGYLEMPLIKNKLSVLLSGRRTVQDWFESPTLGNYSEKTFQRTKIEEQKEEVEIGERIADQSLNFYDWNAKVLFQAHERISFKGAYFKSQNHFNYQSFLLEERYTTNDEVNFDAEALSAQVDLDWSKKHQSHLFFSQSSYSNQSHFFTNDNELGDISFESNSFNDIVDQRLGFSHQWQINEQMGWKMGYDFDQKKVNFNVNESRDNQPTETDFNFGEGDFHNIFGEWAVQKKKLSTHLGLRATYYSDLNQWMFSPRLNLQYALTPAFKFKLSAGHFYQFVSQLQQFGENELNVNNNVWILSENEFENFLNADKVSAGFVFNKNGFLVDVEAYAHHTKGISSITTDLDGELLIDGEEEIFDIDGSGWGKTQGVDVLVRKRWKNYQTWLNYSLSKNDYVFESLGNEYFPASHDQRHNLTWVNNWSTGKWNATLTYNFRTGLPYTEAAGLLEFEEEEEEGGEIYYELLFEEVNSRRLPDYHRLDLGVGYKGSYFNNQLKTEVSFSLLNVLNHSNLFSKEFFVNDWEEEEEEVHVFSVEKQLLKFTPQLMVRVYW